MGFPNKAGANDDNDEVLRAELKAAGIPTFQEASNKPPEYMTEIFLSLSGEVKTSVRGLLYGWEFTRCWYYWDAKGPGIDVDTAEALHKTHSMVVRVDGHCGSPEPRGAYHGLGVGHYHIDSPDGLLALANAIKSVVAKSTPILEQRRKDEIGK